MKAFHLLLALALVLALSSCDSFLDVNVDPTAADTAPPGALFTTSTANLGSIRAVEGGQYFVYHSQVWGSNGVLANWLASERHDISPFASGNYWNTLYGTILRNMNLALETTGDAFPNQSAQLKLMKATVFFDATMIWEDVPFTQAGDPEQFPTPVYDPQPVVLRGIVNLIDEALGMIDTSAGNAPTTGTLAVIGPQDRIYLGRMDRWRRYGNSLKLQALMMLRGGGENVDAEIDALLASPDLIRVAADNAMVPFDNTSWNPLGRMYEIYAHNNNWWWAGLPLVEIMNRTEDPRRPNFMLPVTGGTTFAAAPAGTGLGVGNASRVNNATYMIRSRPEPLMTAHEVLFLEAEILAERGILDGADAKFREGIRQHAAYLPMRNSGSVPAAARDAFIAQFPALNTVGQPQALQLIREQHYVSLYARGIESWNLVRRVGETQLGLRIPVNTSLSTFGRRWPYVTNEITANPNTPQDPNLDVPMFFMGRAQL